MALAVIILNEFHFFLFSAHVKDALQTECSKCSDKQKEAAQKVIRFLYTKKPEQWKLLQEKYDPDDTYVAKYKDYLEGNRSLV
jgi:hypothetical protein